MDYIKDDDLTGIIFRKGDTITIEFTNSEVSIRLFPGKYRIECLGASGGLGNGNYHPIGLGGYIAGTLKLTETTTFHAYAGRKGANFNDSNLGDSSFNGGGFFLPAGIPAHQGGNGGGATDIRLVGGPWNDITSLRSRIMVAGAGGGAGSTCGGTVAIQTPGHGGGLKGQGSWNNVPWGYECHNANGEGGTQTSGGRGFGYTGGNMTPQWGLDGSFGKGADANTCGAGAGSGYYGGGSGYGVGSGGGSSFISGMPGCNAIDKNGNHTGQPIHYSGIIFEDCVTQTGVHNGDGRIIITVEETNSYLINDDNVAKYFDSNDNVLPVGIDINNLTASVFAMYGTGGRIYEPPFLDKEVLSLLVCQAPNTLNMQMLFNDTKIINENYIALDHGQIIYKMQINENLNSCKTKYIFCIDDRWFWFNNGIWNLIELSDFTIENGNTATQINSFTETNWLDFDKLFLSTETIFQRKIKVCAILSHNSFGKTPEIKNINIWCYKPTEALSISTNKYSVYNYYDKYEIIWNDTNKTSLMIFYE